jgi:hypothetical protein
MNHAGQRSAVAFSGEFGCALRGSRGLRITDFQASFKAKFCCFE